MMNAEKAKKRWLKEAKKIASMNIGSKMYVSKICEWVTIVGFKFDFNFQNLYYIAWKELDGYKEYASHELSYIKI